MIYLSEFRLDEELDRLTSSATIDQVITTIRIKGLPIHRSFDFLGYEWIENALDRCDAMIAVIDEYWTSSTWKWHELGYMLGLTPGMHSGMLRKIPGSVAIMLVGDRDDPRLHESPFRECQLGLSDLDTFLDSLKL